MHYLVEWEGEMSVSVVPLKALVGEGCPQVGDKCRVREQGKVYSGKVLYSGKTIVVSSTYTLYSIVKYTCT